MVNNQEMPEKKLAIFTAAVHLIADHGFHAAPTAKIAEEAGIGIGTLYRYFKSKEQLINDLFQFVEEDMHAYLTRGFNTDDPTNRQFTQLCRQYIHFCLENPRAFNFFNQYIDSPYGTTLRTFKRSRDRGNTPQKSLLYPFYEVFNKAKKEGLFKELPNALLFTLIEGSLSNFIRDVMIGLVDYSEETEDVVIQACWDMIKA